MTEIRINDRWGYSKDKFQTILHEHYMTSGIHPITKAVGSPKPAVRETYHQSLRAAVLAAIERESGDCADLESLLRLTGQWWAIAGRFDGKCGEES